MWGAYVAKRGTLNSGMRMEWLMARLSLQISAAIGGKPKFQDFIRFHDNSEPQEMNPSPEAFAALFGAKKKG